MSPTTIECNNCGNDPCDRKKAKKRTGYPFGYIPACGDFQHQPALTVPLLGLAVFHDLETYGYVKDVARIRTLVQ